MRKPSRLTNLDQKTVRDFGREWRTFDQTAVSKEELDRVFAGYFHIFPWERLSPTSVGMDIGCGSGRWAQRIAPRVALLHCIDASSEALEVARKNLQDVGNCRFHESSVDELPVDDASLDFAYSLGVLHHLPDPAGGLRSCVAKLKPGAPLLVYLYYALDNRSGLFRAMWRAADLIRILSSRLPHPLKVAVTSAVAALVYLPLARFARVWEWLGKEPAPLPLSFYRRLSFYTMRTDALDRFGTRVEKRFTRDEVVSMMMGSGLVDVEISSEPPYWCAVGYRSVRERAVSEGSNPRASARSVS